MLLYTQVFRSKLLLRRYKICCLILLKYWWVPFIGGVARHVTRWKKSRSRFFSAFVWVIRKMHDKGPFLKIQCQFRERKLKISIRSIINKCYCTHLFAYIAIWQLCFHPSDDHMRWHWTGSQDTGPTGRSRIGAGAQPTSHGSQSDDREIKQNIAHCDAGLWRDLRAKVQHTGESQHRKR